jgi:hypothetical protein
MKNPWSIVLLLLFGFHAVMLVYDLMDLDADIDPSYYLRALTIAIYALLCIATWRFGMGFAIAYCALTLACMLVKSQMPSAANLGIIAQAFYPVNILFSGVILFAAVAIKKKNKTA